jgi:hypothetical protein
VGLELRQRGDVRVMPKLVPRRTTGEAPLMTGRTTGEAPCQPGDFTVMPKLVPRRTTGEAPRHGDVTVMSRGFHGGRLAMRGRATMMTDLRSRAPTCGRSSLRTAACSASRRRTEAGARVMHGAHLAVLRGATSMPRRFVVGARSWRICRRAAKRRSAGSRGAAQHSGRAHRGANTKFDSAARHTRSEHVAE